MITLIILMNSIEIYHYLSYSIHSILYLYYSNSNTTMKNLDDLILITSIESNHQNYSYSIPIMMKN
jgi:hypothetical protein